LLGARDVVPPPFQVTEFENTAAEIPDRGKTSHDGHEVEMARSPAKKEGLRKSKMSNEKKT